MAFEASSRYLMKIYLFLIAVLFFSQVAEAQRPGGAARPEPLVLHGAVQGEKEEPLSYTAIALYKSSDSSLVTGTAADQNGEFELKAKPGNYFLKASFLSYKDLYVSDLKLTNEDVDFKVLKLTSNAESLEAFTVEAERAEMELKLDKRVFNVSQNLATRGGNASELLDNIPSVTVDVEGNVSLRGSQNVRLLIDGKPSGLTGLSSQDALRMLQGDQIDQVEVITNPSARYDAEGEVGIINLVLKKDKRNGFNGSFEGRVGLPDNHGFSANTNWKRNKINLFASYNINYRMSPGSGESLQEFFYQDTSFYYERTQDRLRGGWNQMARAGVGFDINRYNSLIVSGSYRYGLGDHSSTLNYLDYNQEGELVQEVIRREEEGDIDINSEIDVNYTKTYKRKGRKWTVDFKWNESSEVEEADIDEESDNPLYIPNIQKTWADERVQNLLFQSDYVHPLGKDGKFEMGTRNNLRTLSLDYRLEDQLGDGNFVEVPAFTNQVEYDEDVYAAYVMAGNKTGNLSYQAGLRLEHSEIVTLLVATNERNPRRYTNLFPSANLSYALNKFNSLQMSYSRRIRRPGLWSLLPFFGFTDNRNFWGGNPDLNPEFTHSFETGYLRQWKKGSLLGSVYYRYSDNIIERVVFSDAQGFTSRTPINLGTRNSYGVEANVNYRPKKWWNLNANFNYFRAISEGTYEGIDYGADALAWTSRLSSRWNWKKLSAQTSFNYRSPRNNNQGRILALYHWNAGAALEVLKGKGTLSFSARDILNSRVRRNFVESETFNSESSFQWRARQFTLTFNYRINQKKKPQGAPGGGSFDGGGGMDM